MVPASVSHRRGGTAVEMAEAAPGTKEGPAWVPWGAGVAGALRPRPVLAREAPHRRFRGARRAAQSSARRERPELIQRQFVLVEYGERWYGIGQWCLMRCARMHTQRGVETDSGRWSTSGGDMGLRCPLEGLGLRGSLLGFGGPHGQFSHAA